jgi:pilus assembly protein CpaF
MLIMRSRIPAAEPERTSVPEPTLPPPVVHETPAPAADPAYTEQMRARRALLVEHITARLTNSEAILSGMHPDEATRQRVLGLADEAYTMTGLSLDEPAKAALLGQVLDEFCGFGPIQALLDDVSVSEIMVNGPLHVYVERKGKSVLTPVRFDDDAHVRRVIERIIRPLGRRLDAKCPLVDARLPDGSRVNAVISPVAIDGPSLTIRKFGKGVLTAEDLVRFGTLSPAMAEFLKACVVARLNIIVSGGTGSGKTTLLNVLSGFIPNDERIVTIEDAAELRLNQEHVVRLETQKPDLKGDGEVTIRDLVRNALRMRPERIVVGECRGGETLDMLQAMNTGHDGSLTTLHANTPRDAISRVETMALMGGIDFPIKVVREQLASAVQLIVQQARLRDGSRKITYITELAGMEGDRIVLQELFRFNEEGMDANGKVKGTLRPSGLRPSFMPKLDNAGFRLPPDMFIPGAASAASGGAQFPRR